MFGELCSYLKPYFSTFYLRISLFSDLFYVRNHLPVPSVTEENYELEVEGLKMKDTTLKLSDIKKFPKHTITSTVQCGGNRRSEMTQVSSLL